MSTVVAAPIGLFKNAEIVGLSVTPVGHIAIGDVFFAKDVAYVISYASYEDPESGMLLGVGARFGGLAGLAIGAAVSAAKSSEARDQAKAAADRLRPADFGMSPLQRLQERGGVVIERGLLEGAKKNGAWFAIPVASQTRRGTVNIRGRFGEKLLPGVIKAWQGGSLSEPVEELEGATFGVGVRDLLKGRQLDPATGETDIARTPVFMRKLASGLFAPRSIGLPVKEWSPKEAVRTMDPRLREALASRLRRSGTLAGCALVLLLPLVPLAMFYVVSGRPGPNRDTLEPIAAIVGVGGGPAAVVCVGFLFNYLRFRRWCAAA